MVLRCLTVMLFISSYTVTSYTISNGDLVDAQENTLKLDIDLENIDPELEREADVMGDVHAVHEPKILMPVQDSSSDDQEENILEKPKKERTKKKRNKKVSVKKEEYIQPTPARKLILGREYYYALIDKNMERHWAVPISVHVEVADKFFDADSKIVNLAKGIFGGPIRLRDIYLISRLADEDQVSISGSNFPVPSFRPPGSTVMFGDIASDLYLTLLAPVELNFSAQKQEVGATIGTIYRTALNDCKTIELALGFQLPIKTQFHDLDLLFENGSLFSVGLAATPPAFPEDALFNFFQNYTGLEDFFISEVLAKQGLRYIPRQVKTGVGDLSLFALLDFAGYWKYTEGLQIGINFIFPTGAKPSGTILFEPELGSGVYSFEPFFNVIFNSPSQYFNPTFQLVGQMSARRGALAITEDGIRVPKLITNANQQMIQNVPGLHAPFFYQDYYVNSFSEFDSLFPAFASPVSGACFKKGSRILVGVGNYFFDVFNLGFRLGVFYNYASKGRDKITINCPAGIFDVCAATARTKTTSHFFGLNLTYKFRNMLELNFGSQHVVAGRNIARTNEFFVSLIAVF